MPDQENQPYVFVDGDIINLEFVLEDDCRFGVSLDEKRADKLYERLGKAILRRGVGIRQEIK